MAHNSNLPALEAEFAQHVDDLDGDRQGAEAGDKYLSAAHAKFRAGGLPWSQVPLILTSGQLNVIRGGAETAAAVLEKAVRLYLRDADFRAGFGFTPELEALTLVPTGYDPALPLARIDVDVDARTGRYVLRGVAVDGFTGMTSTVEVTRAVKTGEAYRRFAAAHPGIEELDPVASLVETLRATYRGWANSCAGERHPDHPALGIVGYPEEADLDEVSDLIERFREEGVFARFVDICNLRVETAAGQARLVDDEGPIACAYRLATTEEIATRPCPGTEALVEAARRGLACVVGGFSAWSCAGDALFDQLRSPLLQAELTPEEAAFVAEHLPSTQSGASPTVPATSPLGVFVFGGKLAGVFPAGAEKDIMGRTAEHVYRGVLVVQE